MKKIKRRIGVFMIIAILMSLISITPIILISKMLTVDPIGNKYSDIIINKNETITVVDNIQINSLKNRE